MKLRCNNCGKREAELMSKAEIKTRKAFFTPAIFSKLLDMIDDWTSQKYIVCSACGHVEKQD